MLLLSKKAVVKEPLYVMNLMLKTAHKKWLKNIRLILQF